MSASGVAEMMAAAETPFDADLATIRHLANVIPGAKPTGVNGVRVAASIRPEKFVIAGGGDRPITMPRTAFQVVYSDATLMIDSGLDRGTHDSFSEPDKREPYFADEFAKLEKALDAARLIVLTHFHADHVAGVLQSERFASLARKTIATTATLDHLVNKPHRPHLKLAPEKAAEFIAIDYAQYYPVAPGVVVIKSPGHSPDSQMVFIALADGREILHSVDSAWVMENIRQVKGKAAPWVKEDVPAVNGQLRWLNSLMRSEKNVTILVTHDDGLFEQARAAGTIGDLEI